MTREEFTRAILIYSQINPRFAPDFSNIPVLMFWFDALGTYSTKDFKFVMDRLIKDERFPTIKEVEQRLGVESDPQTDAAIIAGKIVAAISRYGMPGAKEAKEMIGPVGWNVVKLQGGWAAVCEIESREIAAKNAQWRELARSLLEKGPQAVPELLPPMAKDVLQIVSGVFERSKS